MIAQLIHCLGVSARQCFFWAAHQGAELDLFVKSGAHRIGFEIKRTTAPQVTPSARIALADLGLDELVIVHASKETFPLGPKIRAVAASRLLMDVRRL